MAGSRLGILTINNPCRGLWRMAECLVWALEQDPVRRNGHRPAAISVFAIPNYNIVERDPRNACASGTKVSCPTAIPSGTLFVNWLETLDVMIVCEKLMPNAFTMARRQGVRVIYIPTVDWATYGGNVDNWGCAVRESGCEVWAMTEKVQEALESAGVASELVPWSIPDQVNRDRGVRHGSEVVFLINAGMGGWRNRRGVDVALKAFEKAKQHVQGVRLVLKTVKPAANYVPLELLKIPGVDLIEGMITREELARLHEQADAVLYPSRWEGFGLSLLEALHLGVPVIASNGWPMNELVEHRHNGLLAEARQVGTVRLAPHWECSPDALAQEMICFAKDPELWRRITCPDPSELVGRQHRFVLHVRELLLCEARPRVVLFRSRSNPNWRRSEEYWADALRLHGYTVETAFFESSQTEIEHLFSKPHDFTLVSKARRSFLSSIGHLTNKPIVLWHHDLCSPRRNWLESVAEHVDLMCVPESELTSRIPTISAPTLTLLPGAKVDGDRGPGRRPIALAQSDSGPDVVFLGHGRAQGKRVTALRALGCRFDVHAFGSGWTPDGFHAHPGIWSTEAAKVNRSARIALSVSGSSTTPHYTSNRLFHSCGVGACVVAENYPGMDDHYPPEAVTRFSNPDECVSVVRRLLADDVERARMRAVAEDHTWRSHTWADRICQFLAAVRDLPVVRKKRGHKPSVAMWDERVRLMGARAVGYYRWSEETFREETQAWWNRLSPHILGGSESKDLAVLDFGCGTGRFARRLTEHGFKVAAVDISAEMLRRAAAHDLPNVNAVRIAPGESLPFASGTFDALWICLVLQHVPDEEFSVIVKELCRVLRANGRLMLCENTEQSKGRWSNSGHIVYRYLVHTAPPYNGLWDSGMTGQPGPPSQYTTD